MSRNGLKAWLEVHVAEQFEGPVDMTVKVVSKGDNKTHFDVAIPNRYFPQKPKSPKKKA